RLFYIKTSAGKGGKISLSQALKIIGLGEFATSVNEGGKTYITKLAGKSSACPPSELSYDNNSLHSLNDGAWEFATPKIDSFTGGLEDPAPAGTRFTVAFVTAGDLLQAAERTRSRQQLHVPETLRNFQEQLKKLDLKLR